LSVVRALLFDLDGVITRTATLHAAAWKRLLDDFLERWGAQNDREFELGLAGKPAPDTFLKAAELLGVAPANAAIFEDAISGVQAGRAGNFGLVVGVDRGTGGDLCLERRGTLGRASGRFGYADPFVEAAEWRWRPPVRAAE
jgi:beta-phosphoglucomutase-like phosphatase (HAD superfamily)